MTELFVSPSVSIVNNRPATTSLAIAEHFGKKHQHVMRDIRKLMDEIPEDLRASNFGLTFRTVAGPNNSQRQEEYFLVYRDGFILLVMGYTGSKAMQIKIAYIMAFNTMAETLNSAQPAPASNRLTPSTTDDRTPIRALVHAWAQISGLHQSALWPQVKAHFQLSNIKDLPAEWIPDALAFIQGKMDVQQKALSVGSNVPAMAYLPEIDDRPDSNTRKLFEMMAKLMRDFDGIKVQVDLRAHPGGRLVRLSHEKRTLYRNAVDAVGMAQCSLNQAQFALRIAMGIKAMYRFDVA